MSYLLTIQNNYLHLTNLTTGVRRSALKKDVIVTAETANAEIFYFENILPIGENVGIHYSQIDVEGQGAFVSLSEWQNWYTSNTGFNGGGTAPTMVVAGFATENLVYMNSGELVEGDTYRIVSYQAGDDFTNVGAAANESGRTFTATGVLPNNWTNGSALIHLTASTVDFEILQNDTKLPLFGKIQSTGTYFMRFGSDAFDPESTLLQNNKWQANKFIDIVDNFIVVDFTSGNNNELIFRCSNVFNYASPVSEFGYLNSIPFRIEIWTS